MSRYMTYILYKNTTSFTVYQLYIYSTSVPSWHVIERTYHIRVLIAVLITEDYIKWF
jgi:hypothetical protein